MNYSPASAIDWEGQRAFLAVLRTGSLSAAARVLGLSQPTVRRRIAELERGVGAALFTRSPSGLEPTPTARVLGEHALAMAAAAEAFMRDASGEAEAAAGVVRITASEMIGAEVLPPILTGLRRAYPGIVIELGLSNRSEDLLRREADIAVRMTPPKQQALVARRIGGVRLGLFGHRHYLEQAGRPADVADIRRFALIGFEHEPIGAEILRAQGLDFGPEDFAFRCDSDIGQLAAIRAGFGLGVCQVGIASRDPDLVRLLPETVEFQLETAVVMHEDLRGVRRMRVAFDHLVEGLMAYVASP